MTVAAEGKRRFRMGTGRDRGQGYTPFGSMVVAAYQAQGLTQTAFANSIGIPQATLSSILNGLTYPFREDVDKIAEGLGFGKHFTRKLHAAAGTAPTPAAPEADAKATEPDKGQLPLPKGFTIAEKCDPSSENQIKETCGSSTDRSEGEALKEHVTCTCDDREPGDLHAVTCPMADHLNELDGKGLLPKQAEGSAIPLKDWFDEEAAKDEAGIQDSAGVVERMDPDYDGVITHQVARSFFELVPTARLEAGLLVCTGTGRGIKIFRVKG